MAFVRLAVFPGAGVEHYRALERALPPGPPPAERLVFAAGPVEGGWQVVQVWTTRDALDRFNAERLLPALAALGEGGFPVPPRVTDFETVDLQVSTEQ